MSKTSTPEFTLKFVFDSYYVPPTYKTDPYTGKSVIDREGYTQQNNTLQIKIVNQAFISQIDSSGNSTTLYYAVAFKGHYEEKWNYQPSNALQKGRPDDDAWGINVRGSPFINASKSEYTIIPLYNWQSEDVLNGGQIDVKVQALIGHDNIHNWGHGPIGDGDWVTYYFNGKSSDWSQIQTVTISHTAESNTEGTFSVELATVTVVCIVITVSAVSITVVYRKLRRKSKLT
jgi:hypothetical protein